MRLLLRRHKQGRVAGQTQFFSRVWHANQITDRRLVEFFLFNVVAEALPLHSGWFTAKPSFVLRSFYAWNRSCLNRQHILFVVLKNLFRKRLFFVSRSASIGGFLHRLIDSCYSPVGIFIPGLGVFCFSFSYNIDVEVSVCLVNLLLYLGYVNRRVVDVLFLKIHTVAFSQCAGKRIIIIVRVI